MNYLLPSFIYHRQQPDTGGKVWLDRVTHDLLSLAGRVKQDGERKETENTAVSKAVFQKYQNRKPARHNSGHG